MPLVIFAAFALTLQAATIGICLLIERYFASWLSVIAFGVLYIIAFGIAWKLTVWLIDGPLARIKHRAHA